jgi:hypothetical protein
LQQDDESDLNPKGLGEIPSRDEHSQWTEQKLEKVALFLGLISGFVGLGSSEI